jgi:DNA anti-recombination protein RmuC
LNNINNTLYTIITIVTNIPFVGGSENKSTLTKIIDDFSQRNRNVIAKITNEKDDLAKEIGILKHSVDTLSKELEKKKTEVVSLAAEFQNQFTKAQDKRSNDFFDTQKKREDEFKNKENDRDTQFNIKTNEFSTSADTTLKELSNIKNRVESIYEIIGKSSIIGSQKIYADKAKIMAHILLGASLLFAVYCFCLLFS